MYVSRVIYDVKNPLFYLCKDLFFNFSLMTFIRQSDIHFIIFFTFLKNGIMLNLYLLWANSSYTRNETPRITTKCPMRTSAYPIKI